MKFMYSSFQCSLLSLVSFLTLRRTRKFIQPPWYKGRVASYPDVSLSMKMCAQKKAGRRQRARRRFACRLYPSHGPLRFITNRSQLPCEKRSAWGGGGWGRGVGGGVDGTPPRSFWHVAVFRNDFTFSGKPLIFLTGWGIFYGWWRCWGLWRHQQRSPSWPQSWTLPRIKNQVKTARNSNFLCFTWKVTHK